MIGQTVHSISRNDMNMQTQLTKMVDTSICNDDREPILEKVDSTDSQTKIENLFRIYSKKVDLVDSSKLNDVNLGQLHMSLLYNNSNQTVRIHILKGDNLKIPKIYLNREKKPSNLEFFIKENFTRIIFS